MDTGNFPDTGNIANTANTVNIADFLGYCEYLEYCNNAVWKCGKYLNIMDIFSNFFMIIKIIVAHSQCKPLGVNIRVVVIII